MPANKRDELPKDLRPIVVAAYDLAYYRTLPAEADVGPELARSVAHELLDRVGKLPEVVALLDKEDEDGMDTRPRRRSWKWLW